MSTTLFFLVPIGMLAVIWSVCHEAHPLAARHLAEYYPWMIRPVAPNAGSK
jgi:hypothetical protein